jgi:hypothetical protein
LIDMVVYLSFASVDVEVYVHYERVYPYCS